MYSLYYPDSATVPLLKNTDRSLLKDQYDFQIKLENKIANERFDLKNLDNSVVTEIYNELYRFDFDRLGELFNTLEVGNPNYHLLLLYIVQIFLKINKTIPEKILVKEEIIRHFVHLNKKIGAESVEGIALLGDMEKLGNSTFGNSLIVVKVPRNINSNMDHEFLTGIYVANQLKSIIPNFTYVYGIFGCSYPNLVEKKVITFCDKNSTEKASYMMIENIKNSQTLRSFITSPESNPELVVLILIQILQALYVAEKKFGYRHNDLHYDNVLVKRFTNPITINYTSEHFEITGSLTTNFVVYIIDYGYSRFYLKEDHPFGLISNSWYDKGISSHSDFQIFDIFKLICFLGLEFVSNGKDVGSRRFEILNELFSLITTENFKDRIAIGKFYEAPLALSLMKLSDLNREFHEHLKKKYKWKMNPVKINSNPEPTKESLLLHFKKLINPNFKRQLQDICLYNSQTKDLPINEIRKQFEEESVKIIDKFNNQIYPLYLKVRELAQKGDLNESYLLLLSLIPTLNDLDLSLRDINCVYFITEETRKFNIIELKKVNEKFKDIIFDLRTLAAHPPPAGSEADRKMIHKTLYKFAHLFSFD